MIQLAKARKLMEEQGLEVLIAGSLENVYYATGYYSRFSFMIKNHVRYVAIPRRDDVEPFVVAPDFEAADFRKYSQFQQFVEYPTEVYVKFPEGADDFGKRSAEQAKDLDLSLARGEMGNYLLRMPALILAKALKKSGLERSKIGIDMRYVARAALREVEQAIPYAELVDASGVFSELRAIKTEREVDLIRKAVGVTENAIMDTKKVIKEGASLLEVYRTVKKSMTDVHSDPFELGIGVHGYPGVTVTEYALQLSDVVRLDVGAKYKYYLSDLSRNILVGKEIKKELVDLYNILVEAEERMIEAIAPGVTCGEVFNIGQNTVRRYDPEYTRGHLGHGIGIELHEKPHLRDGKEVLRPGMVLCVEVPYYMGGVAGFNVEDMVLVTEDGHECLSTRLGKELLE